MAKDDDTIPGLVLDPKLEAKLDNLDEHLEPISDKVVEDGEKKTGKESEEDTSKDKEKEEDPKKDESEQSEESDKDKGDESESAEEEESDSKDKGAEGDEDGYAIDEGEEEDKEEPADDKDKTDTKPDDSQYTPEQKYVIDNLKPVTVRGTIGSETEVKEYKVFSADDLPSGFKFVDDREMSAANTAFADILTQARRLQGDYRNQETQKATKEFKQREDAADRQDIAALQRAGELPLFKADPNSADFEKDPGVVLVQEIIDFKETQNDKYLQEYNAGRPYKHIGFEEAYHMFQRENPTKSNPAQTKEDKDRLDQAKRTSKTSGQSSKEERPKARVHSGMSPMDLDNLIESKTADW